MTTELLNVPELKTIAVEKSEQIKATFAPMVTMLEGYESRVNEIVKQSKIEITKDVCADAKRCRLDIVKVRTQTKELHKKNKAEILIAGRAIDGIKNVVTWAVSEKEAELKKIEDHFVNIERERLLTLESDRKQMLADQSDVDVFSLTIDIKNIDDEVWKAYFASKKQERLDRLQAEKEAEEQRIKEEQSRIEEEKRIRAENEKLKLEAIEAEKIAEKKRIEAKEKQDKIEEKLRIEQDIARAKQKKIQDEADKKAEIALFEAKRNQETADKKARDERNVVEERARLEKLEADKRARVEADKLAKIEAKLLEKQRLEQLEIDKENEKKEQLKRAGDKELYLIIRQDVKDLIAKINGMGFKGKKAIAEVKKITETLEGIC